MAKNVISNPGRTVDSTAKITMGDCAGTLQIEYDDISVKTKLFLTRFGSTFGTLKLD